MSTRPIAVAVLGDLPHPPRSGNHLRDLQALTILDGLGYDIRVVAGSRSWPGNRSVGPVGRLEAVVSVPEELTTARARLARVWRLSNRAGSSGHPGPWALSYADAGFDTVVLDVVGHLRPGALLLRSSFAHLIEALQPLVGCLVLDAHDSELLLARSLFSLADPLHLPPAALRMLAASRVDRLTGQADEVWAPSLREVEHLRRHATCARVLLVPNGVPVPDQPAPYGDREPELLLVGGFGYPPNEAAAVRLVEDVLPAVVRAVPEACVTLVGRDLRPELQQKWAAAPVRWLGVVDNLVPLLRRAAALVLAYDSTTATGTPLKVAEAMAQGLPVVATSNATRALGVRSGEHVLNAETPEQLAEAVLLLLADQARARTLAVVAHAWAREHLAPERILKRLRHESCLAEHMRSSCVSQ